MSILSKKSVVTVATVSAATLLCAKLLQTSMRYVTRRFLAPSHMLRNQESMNAKLNDRKETLLADGLAKLKAELGRPLVLVEIGAGCGANFKYFPQGTKVVCVEPNQYMENNLRLTADRYPDVSVEKFMVTCAEDMSAIPSESVDAVVSTLVMCSVTDVCKCLQEIKRILRPGGKFFFLEHIAARSGTFRKVVQRCLHTVLHATTGRWLVRQPQEHIKNAGFSDVDVDIYEAHELASGSAFHYLMGFAVRTMAAGVATK